MASEDMNGCIYPVPAHDYIQNTFMACTREVEDRALSQNIDVKYVFLKFKQGKNNANTHVKTSQELWHNLLWVNVQTQGTHGT